MYHLHFFCFSSVLRVFFKSFSIVQFSNGFLRMYGSYTEVSGGVSSDSYMALTGGVSEDIDLRELNMGPDQLHKRVKNALSSGAAVTCGTPVSFALGKSLLCYCVNSYCPSFTSIVLIHSFLQIISISFKLFSCKLLFFSFNISLIISLMKCVSTYC